MGRRWFWWLLRTVGDVGYWYARSGYPNEHSFVMIPLYGFQEEAEAPLPPGLAENIVELERRGVRHD